jgi:hypothetical protein
MSWLEEADPILVAVMLLTVRPTDRALSGWCPFRSDLFNRNVSGDRLMFLLNMTGAGRG